MCHSLALSAFLRRPDTRELSGKPAPSSPASNFGTFTMRKAIMLLKRSALLFSVLVSLVIAISAHAQEKPKPSPTPPIDDDVPVKVFTEEVRLPVIAVDQFGHYDPTVVPDDILILEDGVAQQ